MRKEKCNGIVGVVDDNLGIREMLKEFFEMKGFKAYTGEDGYQAIELVENHAIGLLLLDLNMPNMNGLEAGAKIKEMRPNQKMIFLTGYDEAIFVEKMKAVGDYDYISKPFDLFAVLRKIRVSLGLPPKEAKKKTWQRSSRRFRLADESCLRGLQASITVSVEHSN